MPVPKKPRTTLIVEIRTSLHIKPNLNECITIGAVALIAACIVLAIIRLFFALIGFVLAFTLSASVTVGVFVVMAVLTRRRAVVKVARIRARQEEAKR
jgi:hypothetical protein